MSTSSNLPPPSSNGVFSVSASILIDAPREKVWQILLDFPKYREWYVLSSNVELFLTTCPGIHSCKKILHIKSNRSKTKNFCPQARPNTSLENRQKASQWPNPPWGRIPPHVPCAYTAHDGRCVSLAFVLLPRAHHSDRPRELPLLVEICVSPALATVCGSVAGCEHSLGWWDKVWESYCVHWVGGVYHAILSEEWAAEGIRCDGWSFEKEMRGSIVLFISLSAVVLLFLVRFALLY